MRPDDRCRSNAVSNQKTWAGRAPLRRVLGVRAALAGCRAARDSALVAWYRCHHAPRTGGAYDSHHRTAGIAGRIWRRGSRVAARGALKTERPIQSLSCGPKAEEKEALKASKPSKRRVTAEQFDYESRHVKR